MNPYYLLLPQTFLMCLGSYLSYDPRHKASWWFPWVLACLSLVTGLLWSLTAKRADGRDLFTLSLLWDTITILSYSVLPLIVSGVRLNPISILGFLMMLTGVLIVKLGE